jgi:hypothetical protein
MAVWQSPSGGSRPVPIGSRSHRSESPTGYSSTGRSLAEPASASPVTNHRSRSGQSIKCAACLRVFAAAWGGGADCIGIDPMSAHWP